MCNPRASRPPLRRLVQKFYSKDLLHLAKDLYNQGYRRRVKKEAVINEKDVLFSKVYDRSYGKGYTLECILKDLPPKERTKRPRKPKEQQQIMQENETQSE